MTTDGIDVLESKAKDVMTRLNPAARDAHIEVALSTLGRKFQSEYNAAPPASMVDAVRVSVGREFDDTLDADLDAVKTTATTVAEGVAREVARLEELPDPVREAEEGRGSLASPLTLSERTSVQLLEQVTVSNLRADLAGATWERLSDVYKTAAANGDRVTLRYLERQRAQGWPGVPRPPEHLDEQVAFEKLIQATRAARVPAGVRDAHARAGRIWSASLDMLHRTRKAR